MANMTGNPPCCAGLPARCPRCGGTQDVRHCCHDHNYVICSTCWVNSDASTHLPRVMVPDPKGGWRL